MGNNQNKSNKSNVKYVTIDNQFQLYEDNFEEKLKELKWFEEEIDKRIKRIEDKLEKNKSLKINLNINEQNFIEKIKKNGIIFPDCFHWTLDFTVFLEQTENIKYVGIYQYRNYRIQINIVLKERKINYVKVYEITPNMNVLVFKRDCKDTVYDVDFPFTILYDRSEIIDIFLHYDTILYKDIVFAYKYEIIENMTLNFDRFVNVVEKWIKWAIEYQEPIKNTLELKEDIIKYTKNTFNDKTITINSQKQSKKQSKIQPTVVNPLSDLFK